MKFNIDIQEHDIIHRDIESGRYGIYDQQGCLCGAYDPQEGTIIIKVLPERQEAFSELLRDRMIGLH